MTSSTTQATTPVSSGSPPSISTTTSSIQSGSSKMATTSLPLPPPTSGATITIANSNGQQICSISEPVCPIALQPSQFPPAASVPGTMTPSSQRRFVVADVDENDSPDELSAQGSTESLPGDQPRQTEPEASMTETTHTGSTHHHQEGGSGVEVIHVVSVPDSTGQREDISSRPQLMSEPTSYSTSGIDLTSRQRSSSLPHKLSSLQSSSSERISVAASTAMPPILERLQTESSDVFTPDTQLPRQQQAPDQQHHHHYRTDQSQSTPFITREPQHTAVKPHPPNLTEGSTSSQPQPSAVNLNPFAAVGQHHSEVLSNAFMYFIFTMNRVLKDPAIQPLIHHLENCYGESTAPPPLSPTESQFHSTAGTGMRHSEDLQLKREIAE